MLIINDAVSYSCTIYQQFLRNIAEYMVNLGMDNLLKNMARLIMHGTTINTEKHAGKRCINFWAHLDEQFAHLKSISVSLIG